ncbi:hypothetical protein OF820_09125 [Oceanotoga sp. DSM 15011]|uniref:hypothetical protein n=1 Tax=Oceanotoga TaxID=1255275 RepID=UPI0021F3D5DE|nr:MULTISPECIES: hypothetical protein [Oceanotoga]UYO99225.1 hypothetical protein OF820_09125 [Oceanotoga sp. DSM 15011]
MFWIFMLFIIIMVIFVLVSKNVYSYCMKKFVYDNHLYSEYILENKLPPEEWINGDNAQKNKNNSLKKINKIIDYFKVSKLVDNDETRENILKDLNEVYENWKVMDVSNFNRKVD